MEDLTEGPSLGGGKERRVRQGGSPLTTLLPASVALIRLQKREAEARCSMLLEAGRGRNGQEGVSMHSRQ